MIYEIAGLRVKIENRYDFTTVNTNFALKGAKAGYDYNTDSTVTERTLTIALYGGSVYIYVDETFVRSISINDTNYFADVWGCTFNATDKFTFGVCSSRMYHDEQQNNVTFTVLTEKYGDEAVTEIKNNARYQNITVA